MKSKIGFALLVFTLLAPGAQARVSLSSIDAKLDLLLGANFDPSRYVLLVRVPDPTTACNNSDSFRRADVAGNVEAEEFEVPSGFTLLLTDIQWEGRFPPTSFVAGRVLRMVLFSVQPVGSQRLVYRSPQVQITSTNMNSPLGTSENLTSPVPVPEGHKICPQVSNTSTSAISTSTAFNSLQNATLRGVLVPNAAP